MTKGNKITSESLVRFFVDRYNTRDLEGVMALCSDSVILQDKSIDSFRQGSTSLKHQLVSQWDAPEVYALSLSALNPIVQQQGSQINANLELLTLDIHKKFIDPVQGPVVAVKAVSSVLVELVVAEIDNQWKIVNICWSFCCHRKSVNANFLVNESMKMA